MGLKELIDKRRYGGSIDVYGPKFFHVAGPVDNTNRAIGKNMDLSNFIDSSLVEEDGQVYQSPSASKSDYTNFLRKLGQAYLGKEINFNKVLPISSQFFILPLNREKLNYVIKKVGNLDNIIFSGKIKHSINHTTLTDFCFSALEAHMAHGDERTLEKIKQDLNEEPKELAIKEAQKYVQDLLFWKLNFSDYSDHVNISITEKTKQEKGNFKRTFIINRAWSKANQGTIGGPWRVVEEDCEKIILSGYDRAQEIKGDKNKIDKLPVGGALKYLKKVDSYKEKFREKPIPYLEKILNKYEKSIRSKFDRLGTPPKITAIQSVLEEKAKSGIIKQGDKK